MTQAQLVPRALDARPVVALIALACFLMVGCIGNVQRVNIRRLKALPTDTGIQGFVETNSQGGKFAPAITAPSAQVSKTTIGGNYAKKQSTSASFKVTGGLRYGF